MALAQHNNKVFAQIPPDIELPKFTNIPLNVISAYVPAKLFEERTQRTTSLHVSDSGRHAVATTQDDTVDIYDCSLGTVRSILCKKYGAHLGRFTHDENKLVHASTRENKDHPIASHQIRQLDIKENKYSNYFTGHNAPVTGLEMSPIEDLFVSASFDGNIFIWATNQAVPVKSLQLEPGHRAVVNIDPSGKVLAVASYTQSAHQDHPIIRMYDIRQIESGPFVAQPIHDPHSKFAFSPLTGLKFSNDGLLAMVTTLHDVHYVLDAYQPHVTFARIGHQRGQGTFFEGAADFSPDSQYVLTADRGNVGTISVSQAKAWKPLCYLDYIEPVPMDMVVTNHRYEMFMTVSNTVVAMWLPDHEGLTRKDFKR
ncbi:WD repeat-containing protein 82 [Coelomomyces lativittatus]|nr:WD repeat-containing protein 82 [Coelomomyces lativittatus]KAJ1512891.1 WD repeat-containing protein 82 [Coelomomyces lativittatus]KAJ1515097.1 WD repeat-containing protein 82 [Coelomomyces lativittatus]